MEKEWDKKLNIETCGRDARREDNYHYPYEPTPYSVLERLVESGYITEMNQVVDYGCGKGRVGFFLQSEIGCSVIGLDFDERMCDAAQKNFQAFVEQRGKNNQKVKLLCQSAEKYEVEDADTFYYPSDEYISFLMTVPELCFVDEIDCQDLFDGDNQRERIVIFEVI